MAVSPANGIKETDSYCCYHPTEVVVGKENWTLLTDYVKKLIFAQKKKI